VNPRKIRDVQRFNAVTLAMLWFRCSARVHGVPCIDWMDLSEEARRREISAAQHVLDALVAKGILK